MGKGSPWKTLAAMMLGFALAAVGMDMVTGQLRLNFGFTELMRGFDFLIAVIGLFGIGEILLTMEERLSFTGKTAKLNLKVVLETWKKLPKYWLTSLRSCIIGCWMGITPGGATPASFMSYGIAKRSSRDGAKFGTGQLEGVVAPETAAHAAGTSALLPMLALGIPGSPTAAVLLGGLLIWGLQPGPLLFVEKQDFVWGLIASMYLGNVVGLLIVLTCVPLFAAILRIPFSIIAPIIIVICAIGAYTVHSAMFDIWLMLLFGVIGYVFKKLDYPLAPLVLALVLGDRAEDSFRQSMLIAQGNMSVFFSNWLVGSITALALVMLFWPLISKALAVIRSPSPSSPFAACTKDADMPVVALTQEMGSLSKDVAEALARDLGLATMRHEVVDHVASKMLVSRSLIKRLREGKAGTIERLTADREGMAIYSAEEVLEIAARGNVVLRGWGATCLLRAVPHVVCVRVTRPFAKRVEWLLAHLDTDDAEFAADEIRRSDQAHAARMHAQFGVTWGDPLLYDLVLNTEPDLGRKLRAADPCADGAARIFAKPKRLERCCRALRCRRECARR